MQIKAEQLSSRLSTGKALPPLIWIAGDEPLLQQECCDLVRASAASQGFSEREVLHAGSDFNWSELLQTTNNLSLFAEQRLIDLRLPQVKLDATARDALVTCATESQGDTLLLISSPRVEKAMQSAKWFKAVEAAGLFVPVWPLKLSELPRWITQRCQHQGLSIEPEAATLLAERVEGNLLAASQDIEKLAILCDTGHVDLQAVRQSVADSARFDVFSLLDATLTGDAARALRILNHLQAEGEEALMILNMLCREIRQLLAMRSDLDQGQPLPAVMQKHRVWSNRRQMTERVLSQHDHDSFSVLLHDARVVDLSVKGRYPNNPWDELADLLLRLAGIRLFETGTASQTA